MSSAYKLQSNGYVVRLADGAWVPPIEGNADWAAYQAWLDAGNTPDQADAVPSMSPSVTAAQAKLALYNAGLLDQVQAAVAQYTPYQIFYDSASEWQRNHPYVMGLGQELSLTDAQIDALFDQASQL